MTNIGKPIRVIEVPRPIRIDDPDAPFWARPDKMVPAEPVPEREPVPVRPIPKREPARVGSRLIPLEDQLVSLSYTEPVYYLCPECNRELDEDVNKEFEIVYKCPVHGTCERLTC